MNNASLSRRRLLITGAASLLVVSAAGCTSSSAVQPWDDAGAEFDDARLRYLSFALLAPSPHNLQPWRVALSADDPHALTVYPDLTRLLPETDPENRQVVLGLGAFLEAFVLAARSDGRSVGVESFPDGSNASRLDARPLARLRLDAAGPATTDPLFDFLRQRRTHRVAFDPKPVEQADLLALGTALNSAQTWWGATADAARCDALRSLCRQGWAVESKTDRTHLESVELMRIGRREVSDNPDGISLQGPALSAMGRLGILTREAMKEPESRAYMSGFDFYDTLIQSARGFGWLVTEDNRRDTQLAAGRDWLRVHLAATRAGLALHPLSQVLQEFPEMRELFEATHEHLGVSLPARVQGLFRFGYAKAPKPSPRWPLETRLVDMSG